MYLDPQHWITPAEPEHIQRLQAGPSDWREPPLRALLPRLLGPLVNDKLGDAQLPRGGPPDEQVGAGLLQRIGGYSRRGQEEFQIIPRWGQHQE